MPRYRLTVEYDGTSYRGWQRQNNLPTIQLALEQAIEAFTGEPVTVFGAGRTDAGVHARAQVAHVDLPSSWDPFKIFSATNAHLKRESIAVLTVTQMPAEFDARFSATARHYRYRIITRRAPLAVAANRAWNVKIPLDISAMHEAAQLLIGKHDFTTFRSSECQAKSPVKTLSGLDVSGEQRFDGQYIDIQASAPSFLHNQVRSLVGSLKCVGEGRWTRSDLVAALEACDRQKCGPVAPACGLYLQQVDY